MEKKLNRIEYSLIKEDKRNFIQIFYEMILNNCTFIFPFRDKNDIFIRISVPLITLNFYIFVNITIMLNLSSLHLYRRKNKEEFKPLSFFVNILIPFIFFNYTSWNIK